MSAIVTPSWESVELAIHGWITASMCIQAVWADTDGPEPKYPYAVLKVIAGPTPSSFFRNRSIREIDGCDYVCIGSDMGFTLNVQVLHGGKGGNSACGLAHNFINQAFMGLSIDEFGGHLRDGRVSINDFGPVIDVSEEVGAEIISRVSADFVFRYPAELCVPLSEADGCIEKVSITTALDAAKTILVEKATCQQAAL